MTILITGSLCWWLIALCMILNNNNNNGDSICLKLIAVFTLLDVVFLIYSVISHVQFLVWVPLWGRTWGGGTLLCGCCRAVKIAVLFWFHSLFCLYCNGCLTLVWIWRCYQRTRRFRGAFFLFVLVCFLFSVLVFFPVFAVSF